METVVASGPRREGGCRCSDHLRLLDEWELQVLSGEDMEVGSVDPSLEGDRSTQARCSSPRYTPPCFTSTPLTGLSLSPGIPPLIISAWPDFPSLWRHLLAGALEVAACMSESRVWMPESP